MITVRIGEVLGPRSHLEEMKMQGKLLVPKRRERGIIFFYFLGGSVILQVLKTLFKKTFFHFSENANSKSVFYLFTHTVFILNENAFCKSVFIKTLFKKMLNMSSEIKFKQTPF